MSRTSDEEKSEEKEQQVDDDLVQDRVFMAGVSETEALLQSLESNTSLETLESPGHRRGHSHFSFFNSKKRLRKKSHHRRQSSISQLLQSMGDGLGHMAEDVRQVAGSVKEGWIKELNDADEGRTTFLESGVLRNLSVLPDDLEELYDEFRREEEAAATAAEVPAAASLFALIAPYLSLFLAVMAHSSHGTALSLQKGVSPAMKLYWRMISVAFTLLFFAVPSFCKNGFPKLNFGQWSTLLLAAFCYSTQNLCFVTALDYTSIGNVVLFANTQAVLLLAGKALTGTPVLCLEVLGASIAVGGAMLCATDTHRDKVDVEGDEDVSSAIRGDILAMMSALLGVGYLTFAKAVRPLTPVLSFMFIMMCTGSFIVLSFMAIMHEQITFDNHPYHGLFGWVNWRPDRLPVELWIVFVVSLIGTMGFIRALMYFDSIVIAVATLLEPMTASIIATIAHVGVLPGPQGWVGNLLVILGTFGVVYPSATKEAASSEH